jgi:hypothetical protein
MRLAIRLPWPSEASAMRLAALQPVEPDVEFDDFAREVADVRSERGDVGGRVVEQQSGDDPEHGGIRDNGDADREV